MWTPSAPSWNRIYIYIYIYAAHIPAHNLGTMQFLELVPFSVIWKTRKTGPAKKGPAHRWRIPWNWNRTCWLSQASDVSHVFLRNPCIWLLVFPYCLKIILYGCLTFVACPGLCMVTTSWSLVPVPGHLSVPLMFPVWNFQCFGARPAHGHKLLAHIAGAQPLRNRIYIYIYM